jgi:hypothetical protein
MLDDTDRILSEVGFRAGLKSDDKDGALSRVGFQAGLKVDSQDHVCHLSTLA